jgi:hypothetical protein
MKRNLQNMNSELSPIEEFRLKSQKATAYCLEWIRLRMEQKIIINVNNVVSQSIG